MWSPVNLKILIFSELVTEEGKKKVKLYHNTISTVNFPLNNLKYSMSLLLKNRSKKLFLKIIIIIVIISNDRSISCHDFL